MPEYKLIVNDKTAMILDADGRAVDTRTASALLEMQRRSYGFEASVYILHDREKNIYKIGMTRQPVNNRVMQVRYSESTLDIVLIHVITCDTDTQAADLEFVLHSIAATTHIGGEWFNLPLSAVARFQSVAKFTEAMSYLLKTWWTSLKSPSDRQTSVYNRCKSELDQWYRSIEEKRKSRDERSVWLKSQIEREELQARRNALVQQIQSIDQQMGDV